MKHTPFLIHLPFFMGIFFAAFFTAFLALAFMRFSLGWLVGLLLTRRRFRLLCHTVSYRCSLARLPTRFDFRLDVLLDCFLAVSLR